jgi:hypothetical protein
MLDRRVDPRGALQETTGSLRRITAALPAPLRAGGPALRPNPRLVTESAFASSAPSCRVRQRMIRYAKALLAKEIAERCR